MVGSVNVSSMAHVTQTDPTQVLPPPQTLPHAPQFAESLVTSCSQPFEVMPSQSAKPSLHLEPQTPTEQVAAALAGLGHTVPQSPPWPLSLVRSASQPFDLEASQSAKPARHT